MWKRRKKNSIMLIEMFVSFLLIFALSVMLLKNYLNFKQEKGFNYKYVSTLSIKFNGAAKTKEDKAKRRELVKLLQIELLSLSNVEYVSKTTSNVPYSMGMYGSHLKYGERESGSPNRVDTDSEYFNVLSIKPDKGRWFTEADAGNKEIPIVINGVLKDELFENEPPLNKVIHSGKYKVVGIVNNFKIKGEYGKNSPTYFTLSEPSRIHNTFLIKTNNISLATKNEILNTANAITGNWSFKLKPLSDYRKENFRINWIPVLIFSGIAGFLIINILLGLVGLLLYNVKRRQQEIGLRQSVGATITKIVWQFITEMQTLLTLSAIPAIIIAIQLPILKAFGIENKVYILAIICTLVILYCLVTLCSLFPSLKAVKVPPAVALHEE